MIPEQLQKGYNTSKRIINYNEDDTVSSNRWYGDMSKFFPLNNQVSLTKLEVADMLSEMENIAVDKFKMYAMKAIQETGGR